MAIKIPVWLDKTLYALAGLGAVNWGLTKVFTFNLVDSILSAIGQVGIALWVYGAVGIAGAYTLYDVFKKK